MARCDRFNCQFWRLALNAYFWLCAESVHFCAHQNGWKVSRTKNNVDCLLLFPLPWYWTHLWNLVSLFQSCERQIDSHDAWKTFYCYDQKERRLVWLKNTRSRRSHHLSYIGCHPAERPNCGESGNLSGSTFWDHIILSYLLLILLATWFCCWFTKSFNDLGWSWYGKTVVENRLLRILAESSKRTS